MSRYQFMSYADSVQLVQDAGFKVHEMQRTDAKVATCPQLGDRIIAMVYGSSRNTNTFFLNPDDILSNPASAEFSFRYAGGDRNWMGPEGGGRFSFFHKRMPLSYEGNWHAPEAINVGEYKPEARLGEESSTVNHRIDIKNLHDNRFVIDTQSDTAIIPYTRIRKLFGDRIGLNIVGVKRSISYTNAGTNAWNEDYGMPFIWAVSMMGSDEHTVVGVPYNSEKGPGPVDYAFDENRPIPGELITKVTNADIIKSEGSLRWKVGVGKNSTGLAFSLIPSIETLVIVKSEIDPAGNYMDNKISQEATFSGGAVVEAYSNRDDPSMPERWHELEFHSPNLRLQPGQTQKTPLTREVFFVRGNVGDLEKLVQDVTNNPEIVLTA